MNQEAAFYEMLAPQRMQALRAECAYLFEDPPYRVVLDQERFKPWFERISVPLGNGFVVDVNRKFVTEEIRETIDPADADYFLKLHMECGKPMVEGITHFVIALPASPIENQPVKACYGKEHSEPIKVTPEQWLWFEDMGAIFHYKISERRHRLHLVKKKNEAA